MKKSLWRMLSIITAVACLFGVAGCEIKGVDGKDGVGIKTVHFNEYGELIVELTEGEAINLGTIETTETESVLNFYYLGDGTYGVKVKDENKHINKLEIPSLYKGKPVSTLLDDCCLSNLYLKEVIIPESIVFIRKNAFRYCKSLTNIVIPKSVESIDKDAFNECELKSVLFEDTTTWYYTSNYENWINKANGTEIDVNNAVANATYFKSTYDYYYWYKL